MMKGFTMMQWIKILFRTDQSAVQHVDSQLSLEEKLGPSSYIVLDFKNAFHYHCTFLLLDIVIQLIQLYVVTEQLQLVSQLHSYIRGKAIMFINLSIALSSNSHNLPIMLTDFYLSFSKLCFVSCPWHQVQTASQQQSTFLGFE